MHETRVFPPHPISSEIASARVEGREGEASWAFWAHLFVSSPREEVREIGLKWQSLERERERERESSA